MKTAATSGPDWGLSWSYDRYGNRLSQTSTKGAPPTNALSIYAGSNRVSTWTYDGAGNVLSDGRNAYAYDAENRVISINGGATTYTYDAFGVRVQKTTGSTALRYYFGMAENTNDSWTKILVATAAGTVEYDYATTTFRSNDHLGNARVITNISGAAVGRPDLYPYGEIWSETGTTTKFKFTGKERDAESSKDDFGARQYYHGYSRMLSVDPVWHHQYDPQSLNRYPYSRIDPLNLIERNGKWYECGATSPETGRCLWYYWDDSPHSVDDRKSPDPAKLGFGGSVTKDWIRRYWYGINTDLTEATRNGLLTDAKNGIDARTSRSDCRKFLAAMIGALEGKLSRGVKSVSDLLSIGLSSANFNIYGAETGKKGMSVGGYVFAFTDGNAINLGENFFDSGAVNSYNSVGGDRTSTILHELFHLAAISGNGKNIDEFALGAASAKAGYGSDFGAEVRSNCGPGN